MTKEKCILCGRETVSVIKTGTGYVCFNCYAESKVAPGEKEEKRRNNNEEARMQMEFFNLVPLYFPNLPERVLFAVPNGGSRHKIEAANMKRQGVKRGVADVILLIPKKGFASLCLEFKTKVGKQSTEQKEFQKQAESCRNKYVVVRSASQAIKELRKYLS